LLLLLFRYGFSVAGCGRELKESAIAVLFGDLHSFANAWYS
jgi:hypothetical protein